jgi:ribosome recycling factor
MAQAVEHLRHELAGVRTGRASPTLLDGLTVHGPHGDASPLSHVATVVLRGARTLVVTPHDPASAPAILSVLRAGALDLNARQEGPDIIVPVPECAPLHCDLASMRDVVSSMFFVWGNVILGICAVSCCTSASQPGPQ